MAEDEKPELEWEEAERLGPYQLREQVQASKQEPEALYRAVHEASGVPALVLKPEAEAPGTPPAADWEVRCVSSSSPAHLAVEVRHSRWAVAPDKHGVESLVCALEDVRDGVERMLRHLSASEPRPEPRRWGLKLALGAAACALLAALLLPAPVSDASAVSARTAPAPLSLEAPTDTLPPSSGNSLRPPTDGGTEAFAHPFPRQPYKGQKRPPCTPLVEVEINGGCWVPHELKAPCPKELYEYQGKCYTTAMLEPPPPTPQALGK